MKLEVGFKKNCDITKIWELWWNSKQWSYLQPKGSNLDRRSAVMNENTINPTEPKGIRQIHYESN